jgi:ATP-dependent DNA ligase
MRRFARLFHELDSSNATGDKVAALVSYFRDAPAVDAAWAVAFLTGRRPRRAIPANLLGAWAAAESGTPGWLFEECYQQVGDLAETITLLLPAKASVAEEHSLAWWVEERLIKLGTLEVEAQRATMLDTWRAFDAGERFVWNKLITGGFRVGASLRLVIRALAQASGIPEETIAHRMAGAWEPSEAWYRSLVDPDAQDTAASRPYPFFLAYQLDIPVRDLGQATSWLAEWKWDGIRAQVIRRGGETWIWSRGEELLRGRFPELEEAASLLPDGTVLDGEILPWRDGAPLPFALLQRRITRKTVTAQVRQQCPVVLMTYDLLELGGVDQRPGPLSDRRGHLARLIGAGRGDGRLLLSEGIAAGDWPALEAARGDSRVRGAEGIMLKRLESPYGVGRRRGDWWKWKIDPYSVDAVLLYAQPGHGRRAGLFTDYTFGVWDGDHLVTFAKAYSGLTDEEIRKVDAFVRANTVERFGPVRAVQPRLVFELAFEGIQTSPRHKSGIAVRFPRMARWRTDKKPEDADSVETLRALLASVRRETGDG